MDDNKRISRTASQQNFKRLPYYIYVAAPISLLHIILFSIQLDANAPINEYKWRLGIIFAHVFIEFVLALMFIVHIFNKKNRLSFKKQHLLIDLFFVVFLLIAIGIVLIDQWVTSAITPFMVVSVILSLMFIVPPKRTILFFILGYIIYYFTIPLTQTDQSILMSNRVNGLTVAGIGMFLSIIMWRHFNERQKQIIVIEKQSLELEIQNTELKKQSEELHTEIDIKNKIFSIIAHDLSTPFNVILGLSEVLKDATNNFENNKIIKYAEAINHSADQANHLLENLLWWGRMQSGKIALLMCENELKPLVAETFDIYRQNILKKEIHTIIEVPDHFIVSADNEMLKTILRNLISNAIKFSFKNGTITISAEKTNEDVIIGVTDNGIGINNEKQKGLFDVYEGQSTKGTYNEAGTGLGLSICRDFAQRHGGKIEVFSENEKGTTFTLRLPTNFDTHSTRLS